MRGAGGAGGADGVSTLRASGEETEAGLAFGVLDQLLGSALNGHGGHELLAALRGEEHGSIEPMVACAGLLDGSASCSAPVRSSPSSRTCNGRMARPSSP